MSHLNKNLIRLVPLALIIVFIIGAIGPIPVRADPGWYDTDWGHRKKITINNAYVSGSTNLTNFPVLISIVDSDLIGKTLSSGDDIIFTASDEVTRLSHEIESYNSTSGNLTAWVKIPSLSPTTNTDIYMYYDNAGASNSESITDVWNTNYMMVQHLHETAQTVGAYNDHLDSTSNNNDGEAINGVIMNSDGQINGGDVLGGTNEHIEVNDSASLDITNNITVEAWVKPDSGTFDGGIHTIVAKYNYDYYELHFRETDVVALFINNNKLAWDSTGWFSAGNWYHLAATYDSSTGQMEIYVNGAIKNSQSIAPQNIATNNNSLYVGSRQGTIRFFDGTIDEVRISSTARSADWILTSYNNQNNPSAFFTLGSEKNAPAGPTVVGGKILIVNKAMVLAPWILIAIALCIVIIRLIQHFRKKASSRSPHKDTP